MIIAVNTRFSLQKNNTANYIESLLIELANKSPQHRFLFFTDVADEKKSTLPENILLIVKRSANNALTAKLWLNYQLPALLKKHQANLLINTRSFSVVKTTIPQWIVITNTLLFDLSKRKLSDTINSVTGIITDSLYLKTRLDGYSNDSKKISLLYNTAPETYQPISWDEKQLVLNTYSGDKEYFLCHADNCAEEKLIGLLKAFTIFKKWQKSNMQLIIAANTFSSSFTEDHKNYKYKSDVILLNGLAEKDKSRITGAAYGYINPDPAAGYAPLLQAMQSNIPVITYSDESIKEICGNSVLYCNSGNHEQLAKNMILLYKDENLRNELITNGLTTALQYSYAASFASLSDLIQ